MGAPTFDTALTTLAAVKIYLNVETTGRDTQLSALVSRYSALVSRFCRRAFVETAASPALWTEYLTGNGSRYLSLRATPVTNISTAVSGTTPGVWVDAARQFSTAETLSVAGSSPTGDFLVEDGDLGRLVRLNGVWPTSPGSIKTIWQGGYATASVPGPVVEAVHIWIATTFAVAEKGSWAITSESVQVGGGSTSYREVDMPKAVAQMLIPWRREA